MVLSRCVSMPSLAAQPTLTSLSLRETSTVAGTNPQATPFVLQVGTKMHPTALLTRAALSQRTPAGRPVKRLCACRGIVLSDVRESFWIGVPVRLTPPVATQNLSPNMSKSDVQYCRQDVAMTTLIPCIRRGSGTVLLNSARTRLRPRRSSVRTMQASASLLPQRGSSAMVSAIAHTSARMKASMLEQCSLTQTAT